MIQGGITINHKSLLTILAALVAAIMIVPAALPAIDAEAAAAPAADSTADDSLLSSLPFGLTADGALGLTAGALGTAVLAAADQSTGVLVVPTTISTTVTVASGDTYVIKGNMVFENGGKLVIQNGATLEFDLSGFSIATTATTASEIIDLAAGANVSLNGMKEIKIADATAVKFAGTITLTINGGKPDLASDYTASIGLTLSAGSTLTVGTTTVSSPDKDSTLYIGISIPTVLIMSIVSIISTEKPSTAAEWSKVLTEIGTLMLTSDWGTATVNLNESLNLTIVDSTDTAKLTSSGTASLTLNSLNVASDFCTLTCDEQTSMSSSDGDSISAKDTAKLTFTASGFAAAIKAIANDDDLSSANAELYANGTVSSTITANLSTATATGSIELKNAKLTSTLTALGGSELTTGKNALTANVSGSLGSFVLTQKDDEGNTAGTLTVSNAKVSASVSLAQWPSITTAYSLISKGDAGALSALVADGLACEASLDLGKITMKSDNVNVQVDKATLGVTAKTTDKTLAVGLSLAVTGNVKVDSDSSTSVAVNGLTASASLSLDTSKISETTAQAFGTATVKLNLDSAAYNNEYNGVAKDYSLSGLSFTATVALTGTSKLSDATADVDLNAKLGSFSTRIKNWGDDVAGATLSSASAEVALNDVPLAKLVSIVKGIVTNDDFSDCVEYVDLTKTAVSANSVEYLMRGVTYNASNLKLTVLSDGSLRMAIGEIKAGGDSNYGDVKTFSMDLKNIVLQKNDNSRTIGSGSATYSDMEGCTATVSFDQAVFSEAEINGDTELALTAGKLAISGSGYPTWADMTKCIGFSVLLSIKSSYNGDLIVAGGTVEASGDPLQFTDVYVSSGTITGAYVVGYEFIGKFGDSQYDLDFDNCVGCYGMATVGSDKVTVTALPLPGFSTLSAYDSGAQYTLNSDSTVATVTDTTGAVLITATPKEYTITLDGKVLETKYKCGEKVDLTLTAQTGQTLIKLVDAHGGVFGKVSGLVCTNSYMPAQDLVLTSVWASTVTPTFTETNKLNVNAFTFTVPEIPADATAIVFTLANGVTVSIDADRLTAGETVVITFNTWTQGLPSGAVGYQCTARHDDGSLPITFTVPTSGISNPTLYHMDGYGRVQQVNATAVGGGLQKTTDDFSVYYVVAGPSSGSSNTLLYVAAVIIVILAAAGAAYYFLKVRKTGA